MKGKPEVLEVLNDALRHELTAVNQYWLHYRILDNWGYKKLAKHEREESIEEMQHADKLVERILFLEGHPNMQKLDPLKIGENLKEVIECDLKAEISARALYAKARSICHKADDFGSMFLFEELLRDEEGHIDFLETQLDLLNRIGIENYGLLQSASADKAEEK
jgi:bacterioferritin